MESIDYTFLPELPALGPLRQTVLALLSAALESTTEELEADITYQQQRGTLQIWLALAGEQVVGCKVGYERKPGHYYSWLGGVHDDFRARGIAQRLMQQQHAWCRQQGYHCIRTQTYNRWRAMLLLNLRQGFDVVGTVQGTHGLAIVLEKQLK
ncbi:GNAT family N-acetyltransferase [Hymenobacter norwichensis]|uniref:GNAT family N-acetyltransferase n=1 Tax=Hymenobacter norwichensis TaxID=223903 RepID=UPI0003B315F9|nr:GNAT family N-acetyltransferase [Hymenobacter norwichensis]